MADYSKNRHVYFKLTYHLAVVTKYRHKCISKDIISRLIKITNNLFERWNFTLIEMNGEKDHIHVLFDAPPQVNLANTINNYKT
nr:IS200/IS605 family transposase [Fredinandcohnia onubensis]